MMIKTFLLEINTLSLLTFSAENKAKSLRVRLLRLGGTAGGGGFIPIPWSFLFILESRDLIETPLGGRAGGPLGPTLPLEISVLEGGAGAILFPFIILCGSIGEFVANCEAVTAFVFKVPVLLDVMPRPLARANSQVCRQCSTDCSIDLKNWNNNIVLKKKSQFTQLHYVLITSWLLCTFSSFILDLFLHSNSTAVFLLSFSN